MTNTPKGTGEQPDYFSYLLRLWRVTESGGPARNGEPATWRASLQSSRTGEQLGFADLDDLFEFLWRQTGATSDADDGEGGTEANGDDYSLHHQHTVDFPFVKR